MERRDGSHVRATFIVRLRHEAGTPAGEWRGEVEHVQSASLARFADQATLLAFLSARLADAELARPASAATTIDERGRAS